MAADDGKNRSIGDNAGDWRLYVHMIVTISISVKFRETNRFLVDGLCLSEKNQRQQQQHLLVHLHNCWGWCAIGSVRMSNYLQFFQHQGMVGLSVMEYI